MLKIVLLCSIYIYLLLPIYGQVTNPTQADLDANDNKVLQIALTLENLDSSYFDYFQKVFNKSAFIDAGYAGSVWDAFNLISVQEEAHVSILQANLQQRTGLTLPKCNYTFDFITTVAEYVGGARLLENVGTGAYDGSFGAIYNRTLQQAAATIATVEGRHAAYINQLPGSVNLPSFVPNATSPFPNATDYALSPITVASYIMPFIANCSYDVASLIPQIEVVIPVAAPNTSFPSNPTQDEVDANDMLALNYALALETFEATFYNLHLGVTNYTQSDFLAAGFSADDYNYLLLIREHENAHVSFLQSTITNLGGTPFANCTFTFNNLVTNASNFVTVAQLVESAGVSAYDGAINTMFDPHLRQAAATIATVEARHAAFLNGLLNQSSFPSSTDNSLSPASVIAQITYIFKPSCPTPIPVPQSLVVHPYSNATTTTGNATTGNSTTGTVASTAAAGTTTTTTTTTTATTTSHTTTTAATHTTATAASATTTTTTTAAVATTTTSGAGFMTVSSFVFCVILALL